MLWCRLSDAQKQQLDRYRNNLASTEAAIAWARSLSTHLDARPDSDTAPKKDIDLAHGPKLAVLLEIVRQCQLAREKLVVFSFDVPTYCKCYI